MGAAIEKPHFLLRRGFSAGDPSKPSKKNRDSEEDVSFPREGWWAS
jgi:hypothetical protein